MLCNLLLLVACGAADAPQIAVSSGRVLVVDARGVASCAPGRSMRGAEEGALELGAGARADLRFAGRMALDCVGPASCEWSTDRVRLLRADEAGWDWRGAAQTMELWDGLQLHGGPGAYVLRADARGLELRVHAGLPLELRQGTRLLARVVCGGELRVGREAWSASGVPTSAWNLHDWPFATRTARADAVPAAAVEREDWWSPSPWRCAAPTTPPRFAAVRLDPVVLELEAIEPPPVPEPVHPETVQPTPEHLEPVQPAQVQPEPAPVEERVAELPHAVPVHPEPVLEPAVLASPPPAPVETAPAAPVRQVARWPRWFARPAQLFLARLEACCREGVAFLARYEAQRAFGVRFDAFAPFDVELDGDRLTLLLHRGASRAEKVRGTSLLEVPPGAAVVLRRGGGLESYAGAVVVRPLRRR